MQTLQDALILVMWTVFRQLQAVLQTPVVEKRVVTILQDDSGRRVDMTEIRTNLFIGDE